MEEEGLAAAGLVPWLAQQAQRKDCVRAPSAVQDGYYLLPALRHLTKSPTRAPTLNLKDATDRAKAGAGATRCQRCIWRSWRGSRRGESVLLIFGLFSEKAPKVYFITPRSTPLLRLQGVVDEASEPYL